MALRKMAALIFCCRSNIDDVLSLSWTSSLPFTFESVLGGAWSLKKSTHLMDSVLGKIIPEEKRNLLDMSRKNESNIYDALK